MPWNDTAQLNMIRSEVREAVIQKIFEVARKFSIIRFDAAMTLAKKHFSRLWYPEPGKGGDIPSRSDHAMTREEFDKVFPMEFWREVVDRINNEMPDTLLLAEAFWLMEGYFVRTLGMHRVYNSAFMHMMMKEENSKYRDLISNTLEFEPEILKRYVNFMSNPDEETAIKQFGTDDKYFGVCMMMITLPGLPMFAHGQIEGYTEKYGMEYQRAYYNETPNQWLVDRHKYEIFPLMKKRYLFSQVANFWLFDFIDGYGNVNENVFAFTNTEHGERALIFYNNKYENTSGTIFRSSSKLMNNYGGGGIETRTIAEALWIKPSQKHFYIFRDHISNLEFIKTGIDIAVNGFYAGLGAFKYLVYLDWREVYDESGDWEKLAWKLGRSGVPNMQRALEEMKVEDIHFAFEKMFDDESLNGFIKTCILKDSDETKKDRINFVDERYFNLLTAIKNHFGLNSDLKPIIEKFEDAIVSVRKLNFLLEDEYSIEKKSTDRNIHHAIQISRDTNYHDNSIIFMLWLIISNMKEVFPVEDRINKQNYIEKLLLDTPIKRILNRLGKGDTEIYNGINLLNIFHNNFNEILKIFNVTMNDKIIFDKPDDPIAEEKVGLVALIDDESVRTFLCINRFEGVWYYSKENFENLLNWILTINGLEIMKNSDAVLIKKLFEQSYKKYNEIMEASKKSEYKLEQLKEKLSNGK